MRRGLLLIVVLVFLLTPKEISAQPAANTYGCAWNTVGGVNICSGFVNCDSGYKHVPENIQTCNSFNTPAACTGRNFACLPDSQPLPGEPGGACRATEPKCNAGNECVNGACTPQSAATPVPPSAPTGEKVQCAGSPGTVSTAIGCIDFNDINQTAAFFLRWGLGIAGGVALVMIGLASFRIMTSQGDPRRLQGGQELLLSAIGGLLMIVLSVYLLRFIGVDLLQIF